MAFTFDDFKTRFFPVSVGTGSAGAAPAAVQDNPAPVTADQRLHTRVVGPRAGSPDHIDGIPIAAILAAIKADPAALRRRREVLEGEIRSVWTTLQELVREYRDLSDDAVLPDDLAPSLASGLGAPSSLPAGVLTREMMREMAAALSVPPRPVSTPGPLASVMPNALTAAPAMVEDRLVPAGPALDPLGLDSPPPARPGTRVRPMVRPSRQAR